MRKVIAGDAEVLAQHLLGDAFEPIGDEERVIFVEGPIVEDQQKFAAVGT
jgi:hypothetical protein